MDYAHSVKMLSVFLNGTLRAPHIMVTDENFNNLVVFINTDKVTS